MLFSWQKAVQNDLIALPLDFICPKRHISFRTNGLVVSAGEIIMKPSLGRKSIER